MATVTLLPNANGFYQQFPVQYPVSGNHYDKVDEDPADNATTYIRTGDNNLVDKHDSFIKPASGIPVGSTITSVRISLRIRTVPTPSGTTADGRTLIRSGTTDVFGTYQLSELWSDIVTDYASSPFTGVAWTIAEIDAMQIGASGRSIYDDIDAAWSRFWCSQVKLIVTYTPPAVAGRGILVQVI